MIRRIVGIILVLTVLANTGAYAFEVASYAEQTSADSTSFEEHEQTLSDDKIIATSINLSENIRLETELFIASQNAHSVNITVPGGATYNVKLTDLTKNDNNYLLYANIPVKHLANNIVYEVLSDNGNVISTHKTSAFEYCEKYKEIYPDGKYVDLIDALIRYSDASRRYFANDDSITDVYDAAFSVPESYFSSKLEGITHYSATLVLESETSLRHYFRLDEGYDIEDYTFFLDLDLNDKYSADMNEKLVPIQKGEYYYIEIGGISPNELSCVYKIGVESSGKAYTCIYGPLNYASNIYGKEGAGIRERNLCAAILAYSEAAKNFMGSTEVAFSVEGEDECNYVGKAEIGNKEFVDQLRSHTGKKILTVRIDFKYIYAESGYLYLLHSSEEYKLIQFNGSNYARVASDIVSSADSVKFVKKWEGAAPNRPSRLELVFDYEKEEVRYYLNGYKFFDAAPVKALPEWTSLGNSSGMVLRLSSFAQFNVNGIYFYIGDVGK